MVSGCYLLCLFITQQSNCGQWYWYTCVFTVQHSRATVDSGTGTHVCIYCATQQSNCRQCDWYMCVFTVQHGATVDSGTGTCVFTVQHSRATLDSGTGTRVYLACNTETVDSGTGTHVCIYQYHATQQLPVVLTHVCIYCTTEQLWTVY